MMRRRHRPKPLGRRAIVIAAIMSVLLPGLGHAWADRLGRALIWFSGSILIAVVLGQGQENLAAALTLGGVLGACAAIDIGILIAMDTRSGGRA